MTPLAEPGASAAPAKPGRRIAFHPDRLWLVLAAALSLFAFWGLPSVPFHPDESTYLFMSGDLETLFSHPLSLAWSPAGAPDLRGHYRLVDAPLTRYLLGIGRLLAGYPPPQVDWDWASTWSENQASGALPEEGLLTAGRMMSSLLIPLDLLLIYWIGRRLGGGACGLLATLLLGLNALLLLHGRRSMAEGTLIYGVLLSLWSFSSGGRRAGLLGLAVAIAMNVKQTGAALIPVGLLALALPARPGDESAVRRGPPTWLGRWIVYGSVIAGLTLALNPVLWKHPVRALQAAQAERMELVGRQAEDLERLSPGTTLNTGSRRLATMIANLYMTPPAFAEAANYLPETQPARAAYLAVPGHNLGRGLVPGGLAFILTLFGMVVAALRLRHLAETPRRTAILLLAATACLGGGIFWLVPLPFQRYVVPLMPLVCLWSAYGLTGWWQGIKKTT